MVEWRGALTALHGSGSSLQTWLWSLDLRARRARHALGRSPTTLLKQWLK
jgi:hypothetical protein